MGGDGGQVIDRATMVRTKGYGLTKATGGRYAASLGEMANYVQMTFEDRGMGPVERHRTRMTQCWLSQEELRDPVVACRLGNLYNKEAMIGAFLNKTIPPALSHVKKLSDLKTCVITWREAEKENGKKRMVCPVSRDDLDSGGARAVLLWPTGVVVGLKSLKELKLKECPVTGKPFDAEQDVIALAPDEEEFAKLCERLPSDAKKRRAAALTKNTADTEAAAAAGDGGKDAEAPAKKAKSREVSGSEVYKNLFTSDREGLSGPRDAFGKPIYNRGSTI